jgi:hypothetical protein
MTASETGGDNFERISLNGQVPIPPMVSCSDFKEQLSLLEKPTDDEMTMKHHAFYITRKFIIIFMRALH